MYSAHWFRNYIRGVNSNEVDPKILDVIKISGGGPYRERWVDLNEEKEALINDDSDEDWIKIYKDTEEAEKEFEDNEF